MSCFTCGSFITEAGRAELHRWLTTPLLLEPVREAWLIQIFFAHLLSNQEIVALLEARMAAMRTRLEVYHTQAQAAIDQNAASVTLIRLIPQAEARAWDRKAPGYGRRKREYGEAMIAAAEKLVVMA